MNLYIKSVVLFLVLMLSAWGIPILISGSTETAMVGLLALVVLPVVLYEIVTYKKAVKEEVKTS